jgi:glucan-binding YG repeat protein
MINANKPIVSDSSFLLPSDKVSNLQEVLGYNGVVSKYCRLTDKLQEVDNCTLLWGSNKSKYLLLSSQIKVSNSIISDGWVKSGESTYYIENGDCKRGWLNLDTKWYHLNKVTGALDKEGFIEDEGKVYYVQSDGSAVQGWLEIENERYYFGERYSKALPSMHVGWSSIDDIWYHFREDGSMNKDEKVCGYYLNKRGKLQL